MADEVSKYLSAKTEMEEFEEFEEAVERVGNLIRGMAAGDIKPEDVDKELTENLSNATKPKRKANVFNDKPTRSEGPSMQQEAFMRMVEEDAKKRARERKERNLKSDGLKMKGNAAYRNGEFEQALSYFNQALDIRRDDSVLYVNRALAYLKLGINGKICEDCDTALKLKDSLKPRLLKSRALYELGDDDNSQKVLENAIEEFPDKRIEIENYVSEWRLEGTIATVSGECTDEGS